MLSGLARGQDANAGRAALDTAGFEENSGFFHFYWDDRQGKVWLRIDEQEQPFLYVSSLATGLGSNPVGLDRGQLSADRIVRFKIVGPRVYLIQENWKFRAHTDNEAEHRAIQDSFAGSTLWSGEIKTDKNGKRLVDLTDFLLHDAHDCIGTLSATGQGVFTLDKNRSYVHLPRTKAFPKNTEFEVALTFASNKPGSLASQVAADGKSITLRQHHSFVELPDAGYRPRQWDPRVGCFSIGYADYGVPIDEPIEQQRITRHRLEKVDPNAPVSPVKKPIVYYVDPGVPQPVRDALIAGASWWSEAFEAAGFQDAFQVLVLPPDADPMDVRYNVIQWVHRATRGWSYGQSVVDPRTGEIIKGNVLLGSLRVRQDHLLFEGLTGRAEGEEATRAGSCGMGAMPDEAYLSQLDPNLSSLDVALARIRQLSAHEVGHTLGFAHNFAASTYADRASVMDYPAPRTKITDGKIDLSGAYGVGIGEWDKFTVRYAYSQFPEANEADELSKLVSQAIGQGMLYITDADARPAGAAHPLGNLWDNGSDPVEALRHELAVRRIAIDGFRADVLGEGQPLADLEKAFVPVYLHHRYQVDATAKMIGGFEYCYAVKADGQVPQKPITGDRQIAALEILLETIRPSELVIPARVLELMAPRVGSSPSDVERFESQTSPIFDPASAIRAAAELTLGNLLQPQRASRLVRQDPEQGQLPLQAVIMGIARLLESESSATQPLSFSEREARRIVERVFVDRLFALVSSPSVNSDVQAVASLELRRLSTSFKNQAVKSPYSLESAQWILLSEEMDRFLSRPFPEIKPTTPHDLPPGSPIGNR